jgi:predicted nucleic acid-binding protein
VGWLIDTSIWIAVERGTLAAADIHAITRQDPVYLSPVNVAEIRFGLELLRSGPQKQRATAMLRRLRRKPQLRITVETADIFGSLAAKLKRPEEIHTSVSMTCGSRRKQFNVASGCSRRTRKTSPTSPHCRWSC